MRYDSIYCSVYTVTCLSDILSRIMTIIFTSFNQLGGVVSGGVEMLSAGFTTVRTAHTV